MHRPRPAHHSILCSDVTLQGETLYGEWDRVPGLTTTIPSTIRMILVFSSSLPGLLQLVPDQAFDVGTRAKGQHGRRIASSHVKSQSNENLTTGPRSLGDRARTLTRDQGFPEAQSRRRTDSQRASRRWRPLAPNSFFSFSRTGAGDRCRARRGTKRRPASRTQRPDAAGAGTNRNPVT